MWVVKVDGNNFLWHWVFELPCSHVPLLMHYVEAISLVVGSGGWLELILNKFPSILLRISISHRLEYILSTRY